MRWSTVWSVTPTSYRLKALTALHVIIAYGGAVRVALSAPFPPKTPLLDLILWFGGQQDGSGLLHH